MRILFSTILFLCLLNVGNTQTFCSIFGPTTLNVGSTATFSVPASLAQCADCYDWDVSNGSIQIVGSDTGNSVQIQGVSAGNPTITLTFFNESGCHTCTTQVGLGSGCAFSVDIQNNYLAGGGTVALLLNTTPSNLSGAIYNWTVRYQDGTSYSTSVTTLYAVVPVTPFNPIVSARVAANYQTCTAIDKIIFFPPISGGFSDESGSSTGTIDGAVKVFPNPATSSIQFKGEELDKRSITIIDSNGKPIRRQTNLTHPISVEDQAKGTYFYMIFDGEQMVGKGSFIKQ